MHRPTLYIGLFVLLGMCLLPPFHTGPVDDVADALSGDDVQAVEYHPVWARPSLADDGPLSDVQNWEIAWRRLFLQFLVVSILTGGIAYKRGR